MRTVVATLAAWLVLFAVAQAQPSCGDPPRVDDQTLKGDLEGKAQFLSKLVGDASLKGQIETARNTRTLVRRALMPTWSICSAALC